MHHTHSVLRRSLGASVAGLVALAGFGILTPAATAAPRCGPVVAGDVNGDGHADVAVGEPGANGTAGAVHVFYGQASGLVTRATGTAANDQYVDQDSRGVPGTSEDSDRFGAETALGDFNDDGCADLAVSAPGEDENGGSVVLLYGSRSGLTTAGAHSIRFADLVDDERPWPAAFGQSLAVGDLDDDGVADLAVGAPERALVGMDLAGTVVVLYGDAAGLNRGSTAASLIDPETPGIPGVAGDFFEFGAALAAGDFDGDGHDELAVGTPGGEVGEDPDEVKRGYVQTIQRGSDGTYQGPPLIDPTSLGIDDVGERLGIGSVRPWPLGM